MCEATKTNPSSQFVRIPADAPWLGPLSKQADPTRQIHR